MHQLKQPLQNNDQKHTVQNQAPHAENISENTGESMVVSSTPDNIQMEPSAESDEMLQMSPDIQALPLSAGQAVASPGTPQSQPSQTFNLPPEQTGTLPRITFEGLMSTHFGVNRIFNGTLTDQQNYLRSASGNSSLTFNSPRFREWNPGANSPIYTHIVNGFRLFSQTFGGVPPVNNIGFFGTRFSWNHDTSSIVNEANVPAVYGGGTLLIYSLIMLSSHTIPADRSSTGPSSVPTPTRDESITRIITHELGHGVVEIGITPPGTTSSAATAPDADLMNDYKRAVGWTAGSNPGLYDIRFPAVGTAIRAGSTPDARYHITPANWNESRWIEQPVSAYMTTHPSEDFPEAVMAYINAPSVLFARSPRRFAFIHQRVHQLAHLFRQLTPTPPPVGDFPAITGGTAVG